MQFFDLSTIFFIVLAVVIFLQLRSVLGRRTGSERPPFDPYKPAERSGSDDNVVPLPTRNGQSEAETRNPYAQVDKVAEPGTPVNQGLRRIVDRDPQFDPAEFMKGAEAAYEMIVTAFAQGDRKTLQNLLSEEVYSDFAAAVDQREQANQKAETTFVGLEKMTIDAAGVDEREAYVTLRIVGQLISVIYDQEGQVIEGDPDHVSEGTDIWTFARDTRSRDPNWKLVATGGD